MSWQERAREETQAAESTLVGGAREALASWVAELMPWTLFVNPATFDPAGPDGRLAKTGVLPPEISLATAQRRFRAWLDRFAREALGRPVEGLMCIEQGRRWGQVHGHGLLWLSGGLRDGDIATLSRAWRSYALNGYIRLQVPLDMGAVIGYATRHTVKQLGDLVLSVGCGREFYAGVAPSRAGA